MAEDLKDLEEHGIVIEENTVVRGTFCAIVGDSLGSHCIGVSLKILAPVFTFVDTVNWTGQVLKTTHSRKVL